MLTLYGAVHNIKNLEYMVHMDGSSTPIVRVFVIYFLSDIRFNISKELLKLSFIVFYKNFVVSDVNHLCSRLL